MNTTPKTHTCKTLAEVVRKVQIDLEGHDFVLLFAYNRVGKTRLSMEFKEAGKKNHKYKTLYFNAFTEDLFIWDNNVKGNSEVCLQMNSNSDFIAGFEGRDLKPRIMRFLERYADFDFDIDYKNWKIIFKRPSEENIKVSRGEQNIFIWCLFLVVVEFVLDGDKAYDKIECIYIDDPITSLDDGNAIAVACDLTRLFKPVKEGEKKKKEVKIIISSHHGLFFNTMWNEIKTLKAKHKTYFYYRAIDTGIYKLRHTGETPFSYHLAMLGELQNAIKTSRLRTYHFNIMRGIMETTAIFFGFEKFSDCIHPQDDADFHGRALNLLSHGNYPVYSPKDMVEDNKKTFEEIFDGFTDYYKFNLHPFFEEQQQEPQT